MKYKKVPGFVLCLVLMTVLMLLLSGVVNELLLSGNIRFVSLTKCIRSLRQNNKHLMLFLSFTVAGALGLTGLFFLNNKPYQSELKAITPDISTPAPAGQTQYGSARWMTDSEKKKVFCVSRVYDDKTELSKVGVVMGLKKRKSCDEIYCLGDDVHTLCIGATRSGKSRTVVLQTIGMLALGEESMIIADAKGELYGYTNEFLKNRGYEIYTIDFKNPLKSHSYNFLKPVIDYVDEGNIPKAIEAAWDITSALVGEAKGEKIWTNGEASVIASSIMSVVYDNKDNDTKCFQNMTNAYYFISEMNKVIYAKTPMESYIKTLPDDHPSKGLLSISEIAPSKTKGSFYTSALTTLRLFTNPLIAKMCGKSEIEPKQIGEKKTALFIILPDERTTYYPLASLLITQLYATLVNEADSRGGRLHRRVNFILDEFGNFAAIPDFAAKLTVGAGRGMRFNLYLQSLEQLTEKYDREVASIIKGNCEIWQYLQTSDLSTLEEISKKLGKYTVSTYSLGASSARYSSSSTSQNVSLMARELLTPDEVKRLKRPYTLVISKIDPAMMYAPDISEYRFNKMFGMGDEEHNRMLRQEREESRELRLWGVYNIPLWNIWKFYAAKIEHENMINRTGGFGVRLNEQKDSERKKENENE